MCVQLPLPPFLGSGPVRDDDLWRHHIGSFSVFLVFVSSQSQLGEPQSQLGGLWIQLGGQLGEPFKEAGRASEPAGRASGPAGRALESAARAMEPAGRALEPVKGSQGGMDGRTDGKNRENLPMW